MKKAYLLLLFVLGFNAFAQQKGISYQAVIINPNGIIAPGLNGTSIPLANKAICLSFQIVNSINQVEYQESQSITTDGYGMINVVIGTGNAGTGLVATLDAVNWNQETKKLVVSVNTEGVCYNYTEISNQLLNYIPYSLYAQNADIKDGYVTDVKVAMGINPAKVGLGNVNNTSDANKPVSTATQTALNLKANATDVTTSLALKENLSNKSSDIVSDASSTTKYPTVKAIKDYLDANSNSGTGTIVDADATTKGKIQLAGDLAGTAALPTVPGLALKANTTDVITALNLKANDADVTTALNLKANSAVVTTELALKLDASQKGVANGVATLNSSGIIPSNQLPPVTISSTSVVGSDAAMTALSSATVGSIAIRTDLNKNYVLSANDPSIIGNWIELLTPAAPVQTVNGYVGSVNLTKTDIDLGNVDNTSDRSKPISDPTQIALNLKSNTSDVDAVMALKISRIEADAALNLKLNASTVGSVNGVASLNALGKIPTDQIPAISFSSVKVLSNQADMLALSSAVIGSVVIRTDENKNYVLAQANPSVLANWIELLTPAPPVQSVNGYSGNVSLSKADFDLSNVNNTSDASKPISGLTQMALDSKANSSSLAVVATTGDYRDLLNLPSAVDASSLSGTLAIVKGGTGATIQNFVDLTTNQTIAGNKNFTGTIGIGTSTNYGNSKLHIDGSGLVVWGGTGSLLDASGNSHEYNENVALTIDGKANNDILQLRNSSPNTLLVVDKNGNMGIGNTAPTEKLEVTGNIKTSGFYTGTGFKTPSGTSSQYLMADGSVDSNSYLILNSQNPVAIGYVSGTGGQAANAIALGNNVAQGPQATGAIGIGIAAAQYNQGENSIAIGAFAGNNGQHANSIVLNATGIALNTANSSALYIAPIRSASNNNVLLYNTTTKEVTTSADFAGNAANVTGIVAIANGGTGATSLTGYVKGNGTNSLTASTTIPASAITGLITKVNGSLPDANGFVTVPFGSVSTGSLATRPTNAGINGNIYVVSGDTNTSDNGRTYISDGVNWNEVTSNQAATDARYLQLAGGTLAGSLTIPTAKVLTITDAPTNNTDATNKSYVDAAISNSTIADATSSSAGKIQLAGDLAGSGGSASSPKISSVGGSTAALINSAEVLANAAVSTNTANQIVKRDASGNFTANIITASLTGNVSGTASNVTGTVGVTNGGSGATSLTGYVKGNGTSAFTSSVSIPASDITGLIKKVNGSAPDADGNVSVAFGTVSTGTLNGRPVSPGTNGNIFVVSGDATTAENGRTYISDGTNWKEVTSNQSATDARYLQLAGGTLAGNIVIPTTKKITLTDAPTVSTDAVNKAYVDASTASASIADATTSALGKIQLGGDLAGSGTSAASPKISSVGGSTAALINSAELLANASTSANTVNQLVKRDVNGDFSARNIAANLTGTVTGNATNVTGVVAGANGGTGVANTNKTITIGGNFETLHALKFTTAGGTNLTLPTSGTLATVQQLDSKEVLSNKSTAVDLGSTLTSDDKYPSQKAVKTYVDGKVSSVSPAFTGIPTAPTATSGISTTQIATTAFVAAALSAVASPINGYTSALQSSGGNSNVGLGFSAASSTIGNYNISLGTLAMSNVTSGDDNVIVGSQAARYISRSFGDWATNNQSMRQSVFVGSLTRAGNTNSTNEIVIGYSATGNGTNTIQLGNTAINNTKTSGTITAGVVTYPNTDGSNGQVLVTNGSGTIAWVTPAANVREMADEFTATVSQAIFTLTQTASANSKVKMYINGIRISNTAYSLSGTTLTYVPANNGTYTLTAGDRIQFDYFY